VAAQARVGFRVAAEAMAVLTLRRVRAAMQRRLLIGVTRRAHVGRRWREAALAVAAGARDLADVRDVPGAGRDLVIFGGHVQRGARVAAAARGDEREHEQRSHGRDPIG